MLDTKFILANLDLVRKALEDKHAGNEHTDLDRLVKLDEQRRKAQAEKDRLAADKNKLSKKVGALMGRSKAAAEPERAQIAAQIAGLQDQSRALDARMEELSAAERTAEAQGDVIRAWIPNVPDASVPPGTDASGNVVVHKWGQERKADFRPKPHHELGAELGILDCERGGKISGSGWYFLRGDGARLERALITWFLDAHRVKGYVELFPPFCVTEQTLFGSGQLPKFLDQMYHLPADGLFAIPTAEVPVTAYHRDEMLEEKELPIKYAAYSACFRR